MLEEIKLKLKRNENRLYKDREQLDDECEWLIQELENKETELMLSQKGWNIIHNEQQSLIEKLQQENERYKEGIKRIYETDTGSERRDNYEMAKTAYELLNGKLSDETP